MMGLLGQNPIISGGAAVLPRLHFYSQLKAHCFHLPDFGGS